MTRLYTISPTDPASVVHFDWLTVVYPIFQDRLKQQGKSVNYYLGEILNDFGLDSLTFEPLKHGLYTYDLAYSSGDNSIILGRYKTDDQGNLRDDQCTFCIQFSGAGVETLESVLDKKGLVVADFIKQSVKKYFATFSRVDACNNFFNYPKEFSARWAGEQAKQGDLVTRSSFVRVIHQFSSLGALSDSEEAYQGATEGYTTYIGKNPKQLRIYNKLAERSDKVNLRYQVKSWSRWEFQLNGNIAQGFIENYLQRHCDLAQTWVDWLATNYRFIEKVGHQAKRSRYPNARWYDELVSVAKSKTIVRTEKQKPTFERASKWIDKQVMPTLASMFKARLIKYMKNGVTYEDARKLALKKILQDVDDKLVNDEIDERKVSAWLVEQNVSL